MRTGEGTAFVTDGNQRSALAITRSLGRRGIAVIVGDTQPGSLAATSRYCVRQIVYPSPDNDAGAFERFLLDFVGRERIDVVVPVTDATTRALAKQRGALPPRTGVTVPPHEAFEVASNKWALLQHAAECGVPVPETRLVEGISGLRDVMCGVRYPAVVKPVRSRTSTNGTSSHAKAHYASSAGDLWRLFQDDEYLATHPCLIQERIVGPGGGIFVLFDRGRLCAAFAHRRIREKPPSGGVSVLSESVPLDAQLVDHARRLLAPLGWHGVAMVEFKRNSRAGDWVLMEVNGRFWGSLQLAIDAGVDFPYLAWQLARGRRPDFPQAYTTGVRSRWLLGDLDHLLLRIFKSDAELHVADSAPSRARAVLEFLEFAGPQLRYDVIDGGDLRPMCRELRQYAAQVLRGGAQLLRRRVSGAMSVALRSSASKPCRQDAPLKTSRDESAHHELAGLSIRSNRSAPRPIRVCHIVSGDLWAGAEVQLATVASYLVERPQLRLTAVLLNEGRLARELRARGVQVTVMDENRHSTAAILTLLRRFLKDSQVDIVHTHRYKESILGTAASKLAGVPHVVRTVHGLDEDMKGWNLLKLRAYEALERVMLWLFADRIIAVSQEMGETLKRRGYKRAAVRHIHNGVDLRRVKTTRSPADVRRELGIGSQAFLVGTAGRLAPVKGQRYFLGAARLILQKLPDARFLIAGDGPLRAELEATATHLGVARQCLLLGDRTDVHDLMASMDAFVLPSLAEGVPMAVLEAMALGKPVVATAVGGVPEILTHSFNGLLVSPRDEQGLADACLQLACDRGWAQTLGARGKQLVEREFSREKNGAVLMEVYRQLVLRPAATSSRISAVVPAGSRSS